MSIRLRHAFKLREVFYPANLLTLARLLMLPAALHAMQRPEQRWRALGILGAAMFTDAIDGAIARRRHEVSPLGKLLDPVADKVMIDATAVTLSRVRGFPWWATALIIGRDVAIILGGVLIYRRRRIIATAHLSGKATTLALTLAMLLYLADGPRSGRPALYIAMAPFAISALVYLRQLLQATGEAASNSAGEG
ncbi:MAG: CDP-alcohol phosphatidyltransferase family protein [Roseiflexus sp.]|nr:CDP-alcohol phosphatidyltransferase family protein [Roseiflexus sp.]MCS7288597.1 CDP-alcohol phosphatidyltransferase family protein [Roseiflexus sp.]MDW8145263.1 CDP-alcohol phosphatidyltransferase family protein [Roseiflexaceae bacterium]MDW8232022.1 CDP-alcohol phosphatidyltransferase family protein [Roseiflexaceae bacterium]